MPTTVTCGDGAGGVGTRTVTITYTLQSTVVENQDNIAPVISNANTNGGATPVDLANGFNAITVPTSAGGVIFILPAGNTQTVTLKGVTGDTGIALHTKAPFVLTFAASPPATIGITTGGAINDCLAVWI